MKLDMEQKIDEKKNEFVKKAEQIVKETQIEEKIISEKQKIESAVAKLKKYKKITPRGDVKPQAYDITMWRVYAYFIIYSFLGYIIETVFALVNYGVFESRQSFLYGPFCSIYGLGAVVIIVVLKYKFSKNNNMLFLGGFLVGSVVEYMVSFFGERILNVKWWDYSDRFLNINGRICLLYSIFWGILGVYLLKVVNPQVDRFINFLVKKFNVKLLKTITMFLTIFLFVDCLFSAFAIDTFLVRVSIENNLSVSDKDEVQEIYDATYGNEKLSNFIYKYIGNEKMIMTYPNLTVTLEDGSSKKVKEYYPDIKSYYYKFDKFNPSV